jgi:hypothetical protein
MNFKEKYTTDSLISKDTTNKEKDKTKISEESFAICELLNEVAFRLSRWGR